METERQVCPSCGSTKILVNKEFFCDWEVLFNEMYLTFCTKCGLAFLNKILSKAQIDILYSDNNYFKSEWCWYGKPYQEVWRERKKEFESKQLK